MPKVYDIFKAVNKKIYCNIAIKETKNSFGKISQNYFFIKLFKVKYLITLLILKLFFLKYICKYICFEKCYIGVTAEQPLYSNILSVSQPELITHLLELT